MAQTLIYSNLISLSSMVSNNDGGLNASYKTKLCPRRSAFGRQEPGLRRAPSAELLRGVFDAAMSVYLDRFLNIPAARIPQKNGAVPAPDDLMNELSALLDRQQQVNQAGNIVARYLHSDGRSDPLLARLGHLLLREDRDFHSTRSSPYDQTQLQYHYA